jgi:hypothetical protein
LAANCGSLDLGFRRPAARTQPQPHRGSCPKRRPPLLVQGEATYIRLIGGDEQNSEDLPDSYRQLERGLAALPFPIYWAVGSPARIIGWGGGGPGRIEEEPELSGVLIGDHLPVASQGPNPPGVNVHTSLRIDNSAERIAVVSMPFDPRTPEEKTQGLELALQDEWERSLAASEVETRMLSVDGVPEPWTVLIADGVWAATRHHLDLTLTIAGRGVRFDEIRLERVANPTTLDRPKWSGKPTGVVAVSSELKRIE